MAKEAGGDATVVPAEPFQEIAGKPACTAIETVYFSIVAIGSIVEER
jgi:hypothetical protein